MALRRLLTLAAARRVRSSCTPTLLASVEELGFFLRYCSQQPALPSSPAQPVLARLMHTSAPAMRSTDAAPPAPAEASAAGKPAVSSQRQAAGSEGSGRPAEEQAQLPARRPVQPSRPSRGQLHSVASRKPREVDVPGPDPRSAAYPFQGTRRAPPPAPSVGGIQAEALAAALGPPQYDRIGKVTGRYGVERTPEFAIVELGPAQYKVSPDDLVVSEKLKGVDVNDRLALGRVLMLGSRTETLIGRPYILGASVTAVVEEQFQDAKVTVFKKRRRKNSRRKMGHRQELTSLRIVSIHGFEAPEAEARPAVAATA